MSSVTLIICTRNRADSLRETLASIGQCAVPAGIAAELLVVDNGSTDHTARVVEQAGLTNLPVRRLLEPPPGLSYARNAGLRASAGKVILFTDDDVRVPAGWVEGMCRPILAGRGDAVAGSVRFPAGYEEVLAREPYRSRRGWFASNEGADPADPGNLVGANMAFARRVSDTLGGFDSNLGAGALGFYEETLFTARLKRAGFRLVSALPIVVEHHFDLSRLTRGTLLQMAERMGKSEAYLDYHWHRSEAVVRPATVRRARLLLWLERLLTPWNAALGRTTASEIQRAQTLAYWQQLRQLSGVPRRYGPVAAGGGVEADANPVFHPQ